MDVIYKREPESLTIPYNQLKEEERYLKGFVWRYYEKPLNKDAIFYSK